MEISEFKFEWSKMELNMHKAIQKCVDEFKEETGYTPHYINVEMVDVTTMGKDARRQHTVANVSADIDL